MFALRCTAVDWIFIPAYCFAIFHDRKDRAILPATIAGARRHVEGLRRVYVLSRTRLVPESDARWLREDVLSPYFDVPAIARLVPGVRPVKILQSTFSAMYALHCAAVAQTGFS